MKAEIICHLWTYKKYHREFFNLKGNDGKSDLQEGKKNTRNAKCVAKYKKLSRALVPLEDIGRSLQSAR